MDILFKNITIVTCDDENFMLENAFLGVSNNEITYISTLEPKIRAKREIDGRNRVLMPGLVNSHTHIPMSILRTIAEDLPLNEWLFDNIFKFEAKLDEKCVEIGATLAIAEMFASGTTSITDMYFKLPTIAKVMCETGIKGNICNASMCFEPAYNHENDNAYKEFCETFEKYHNFDNSRIKIDVGIHAEYTSNAQTWHFWSEIAKKHNLNMNLHLSETEFEHNECKKRNGGKTPTQILDENGVFDGKSTLAHCVFLEYCDIEILKSRNVTIAHNPISNLKLASGIANVSKYAENGLNIALGTDGVASNNTHDLFEEIKIATILAKGFTKNAKAILSKDALKMATINGAKGQGRSDTGVLKVGYKADLIMVDFDNLHHLPNHDAIGSLVYNTTGRDVILTMIEGKIVYENGNFTTINVEKLKKDLKNYVLPIINS